MCIPSVIYLQFFFPLASVATPHINSLEREDRRGGGGVSLYLKYREKNAVLHSIVFDFLYAFLQNMTNHEYFRKHS